MMQHNTSLSLLHNHRSATTTASNDENAIPMQQQKQLSNSTSSSSSSSVLKPTNKNNGAIASNIGGAFPKTPKGNNNNTTMRRRALGDISNRKAGGGGTGIGGGSTKNPSFSSAKKNGMKLTIHNDNVMKSTTTTTLKLSSTNSNLNNNKGLVSAKKSIKKKKKNVTFGQQIYQDELNHQAPLKIQSNDNDSDIVVATPKMKQQPLLVSHDDVDDIPIHFALASLESVEKKRTPWYDEDIISADVRVEADLLDMDIIEQRRRKEEEQRQTDEIERIVDEHFSRPPEYYFNFNDDSVEFDHPLSNFEVFEDEVCRENGPSMEDDDEYDSSKGNKFLDNISI